VKILVVNTKYIGDLILSTPGLAALREKNPDAEIILVTRKGYEGTLKNNPNINRIIPFDFGIKKKNFVKRIVDEINFILMIRSEKFDVVISLHPGDRIAFLAWFSGAKIRVAPRKQAFNFLFNILVDVEEDSISYLEYYNKLISAYTKESVTGKTEFFVTSADKLWADEFLEKSYVNKNDLLIGIHPGASEPTKIWQSKNFTELIHRILAMNETKVLLIAGLNEEKIVEQIYNDVQNDNILFYNSNNINLTAALIKKCKLFISNDTGTRHLAVALKIPVIALMPDDNQKCWNFYDESNNHFVLIGNRIFPDGEQPYLGGISVDDVHTKMKNILNL
jgi:heptosyltransferase-2